LTHIIVNREDAARQGIAKKISKHREFKVETILKGRISLQSGYQEGRICLVSKTPHDLLGRGVKS